MSQTAKAVPKTVTIVLPVHEPAAGDKLAAGASSSSLAASVLSILQMIKRNVTSFTCFISVFTAQLGAYEEDENKKDSIRNRSMGSIETDFTSVTQLK